MVRPGWVIVSLFDVRLTSPEPVTQIFHSRKWLAFIGINWLMTLGEGGRGVASILRPVKRRVFNFSVFTPPT